MYHTTPTNFPTTPPTTFRTFVTKAWKAVKSTLTSTAATTPAHVKNYFDYNKEFGSLTADIANGECHRWNWWNQKPFGDISSGESLAFCASAGLSKLFLITQMLWKNSGVFLKAFLITYQKISTFCKMVFEIHVHMCKVIGYPGFLISILTTKCNALF